MGEMDSIQGGAPVLTKLNVIVEETVSVQPEALGERNTRPLFLSNFDMVMAQTTVDCVNIYPANPEIRPSETCNVADRIKKALSKALVHYDIMAGRVGMNEELNRVELYRNSAGVPFSTASCHALTLEDLVTYLHPSLSSAHIMKSEDSIRVVILEHVCSFLPPRQNATETFPIALMIQVTTFKCGGFVLGVTFKHALHDGTSYGEFFINLLALAQERPLVTTPYLDRTMLRASETYQRDSDLAIAAAEFFALPGAREDDQDLDQTREQPDNLNPSMNQMVSEIFPFTGRDLLTLQREATEGGLASSASRFDVLAAHIFKALTMAKESDPKRVSRLVYAVDFRKRIEPPLPKGFTGNATVATQVSATCQEVREKPFSFCVELIQKANKNVTNDYVRHAIDHLQSNIGKESLMHHDIVSLTTWAKLPFMFLEFDGKLPLYNGPILTTTPEDVIIIPSFESSDPRGFKLLITLNVDAMAKFRKYVKVSDSMIETKLHHSLSQSRM